MVRFDLREAARAHCPRAIEVLVEGMNHKDMRVRILAASLILERGYGKPELKADVTTTHAFAVVPEVLDRETWLRTRGQGLLSDGTVPPRLPDVRTTLDLEPSAEADPSKLN